MFECLKQRVWNAVGCLRVSGMPDSSQDAKNMVEVHRNAQRRVLQMHVFFSCGTAENYTCIICCKFGSILKQQRLIPNSHMLIPTSKTSCIMVVRQVKVFHTSKINSSVRPTLLTGVNYVNTCSLGRSPDSGTLVSQATNFQMH